MDALESQLAPDEPVVFRTRLHPVVFGGALSFAVCALGIAVLIVVRNDLTAETVRMLLLIAVVLGIGAFVGPGLRWRLAEFAVTPRRLVVTGGLFSRQMVEFPLDREAVQVDQTIVGRLLDYGTVHVGGLVYPRVAHALALGDAARRARPAVRARGR